MSTKNSLPAPVPQGEWPSDERGGTLTCTFVDTPLVASNEVPRRRSPPTPPVPRRAPGRRPWPRPRRPWPRPALRTGYRLPALVAAHRSSSPGSPPAPRAAPRRVKPRTPPPLPTILCGFPCPPRSLYRVCRAGAPCLCPGSRRPRRCACRRGRGARDGSCARRGPGAAGRTPCGG